jgi:hypothetical protein
MPYYSDYSTALCFLMKSFSKKRLFYTFDINKIARDVAQPGSALRSGRRGRWFESSHPDCVFRVNPLPDL